MILELLPTLVAPCALALPPLPAAVLQGRKAEEPPPGMVLVPGGRTKVGTELDTVEDMLEADSEAQRYASTLIAETPQHTVNVQDFFLMAYEVTNEQFAAYVRATGTRPPTAWGEEALAAAGRSILEENGLAIREAREQGLPAPERAKWDPAAQESWWLRNWREQDWKIPQGQELMPVSFVDFNSAQGYARWAGLRLPTEQEYQRAVRGNSDRPFPWGDHWDPNKYAVTHALSEVSGAMPVASFPEGANEQGVMDLAGNMWEWTSSPYVAYPGYKHIDFEIGRGRNKVVVSAVADWDAYQRVMVGGSFQNGKLAARCTTRRGSARDQATDAVGFRCAASPQPGVDMAETVLAQDLPSHVRPSDANGKVTYKPEWSIGVDRWERAEAGATAGAELEHYGVVTGYDYAMFIPVEQVLSTSQANLRRDSLLKHGPIPFGVLASNLDMTSPPLPAGTYMISYRGAGERRDAEEAATEEEPERDAQEASDVLAPPSLEETLAIDTALDHLIFYDQAGKPLLAMPLEKIDYANIREGGAAVTDVVRTIEGGKKETDTVLRFDVVLQSRVTRKSFQFLLDVEFAPGALEKEWRK